VDVGGADEGESGVDVEEAAMLVLADDVAVIELGEAELVTEAVSEDPENEVEEELAASEVDDELALGEEALDDASPVEVAIELPADIVIVTFTVVNLVV
jgi:hypothetical protein